MTKQRRTPKVFVNYNEYQDRQFGQKWGTAFAIEELSQAIDINKRISQKKVSELPQQTRLEMDNILQLAFLKSKVISIQTNKRNELGSLLDSIEGKFEGFANEEFLYINDMPIAWDDIRNISLK